MQFLLEKFNRIFSIETTIKHLFQNGQFSLVSRKTKPRQPNKINKQTKVFSLQ